MIYFLTIAYKKSPSRSLKVMFYLREVRQTDLSERARFVWLWMEGKPIKDIAKDAGTSTTTVYRWIRRWKCEGVVESKPRSGRPRVTSPEEDAAILGVAAMLYPMSSQDIIHFLKLKCSSKTVRRRINESRALWQQVRNLHVRFECMNIWNYSNLICS